MLRRLGVFVGFALMSWTCWGAVKEKGQFELMFNGLSKGFEKYKIEENAKTEVWTISSEVMFQLPVLKAKRGFVDLYVYPVLDLDLKTRDLQGYAYRMTYNDFSKSDLVESQGSAQEYIDQDFRMYDVMNRQNQLQDDEMADRIDLGVNAGKLIVQGKSLGFRQTKFSSSRVKDEPMPDKPVVLDSYVFCLYIPLAQRALAMKTDTESIELALPQGMKLRKGRLKYLGVEKTVFRGDPIILRHYDVAVGESQLSSFWVDRAGRVVQIAVPAEGILAVAKGYKPKPFEKEEPTVSQAAVAVQGAFTERTFRIPVSGAINLGATLTLPTGEGPFPTALLVQDLPPTDRDGNGPAGAGGRAGVWKQLAYLLASRGYASLRWDARGVGESGGTSEGTTWDDRVQDVASMGTWLAGQASTKNGKIVVAAEGLGGWVAAEASSKIPSQAFIGAAYPAKGLLRLWREQVNAISDPEARMKAQVELDHVTARLQEPGGGSVAFGAIKINLDEARGIMGKDPIALARGVPGPCLFVYPERDQTVMAFHRDIIASSLKPDQEAIVLPGLGHLLTPSDEGGGVSGLMDAGKVAPIFDWLTKVLK